MDLSGPVCVCLCCVWSHQIESWLNIKGWTSLCRITTIQICSAAPSAPSLPLSLLQLINLLVSLSTISSSYYHLGYKQLSACIWPLSSRIPLLWTDLDQFKSASVGGRLPANRANLSDMKECSLGSPTTGVCVCTYVWICYVLRIGRCRPSGQKKSDGCLMCLKLRRRVEIFSCIWSDTPSPRGS